MFDDASRYAEARKEIAQWLAEGKLQRKETIVKGGLKAAEQALLDLYKGVNTGKLSLCSGEVAVWFWECVLIVVFEQASFWLKSRRRRERVGLRGCRTRIGEG